MSSVTAKELFQKINNKEDILLIDVREPAEHAAFNIGGMLIPLDSLMENIGKIEKNKPVIFYCKRGVRSHIAIQRLQQKYNYTNLVNLSGGMDAWQKEYPSL